MFEVLCRRLISLAFPSHCLHCGASLPCDQDLQYCGNCVLQMVGSPACRCRRCGAGLETASPWESGCALCRKTDLHFDAAHAIGNYSGVLQQQIREMKRTHSEQLAFQLGILLGEQLVAPYPAMVVVPVPTHWWRRASRGFHGTSIVASAVSSCLNFPKWEQGLRCRRLTQKQGTLSPSARVRNVRNAFVVSQPDAINGKHILLVDDVMTSCATASEVARTLKSAGAASVTVGTLARGVKSR